MPFDVSIIICTYNGASRLLQTLGSLAQVSVPLGIQPELLLVDNGSTDCTREQVQSFCLPNIHLRYISEPKRGKSHAYNTALAAAQGEILLCADDDVRFPCNWIEGMCEPILTGRAHAVAGGIKLAQYLERPWMKPIHRAKFASTELLDPASPWTMHGANMAFSKEVLEKVPGFDPELGPGTPLAHHEDTLFSQQLLEAGFRIGSAFDVAVEHHFDPARLTRSAYIVDSAAQGRSGAYIFHHWRHGSIDHPYARLLWFKSYLGYRRAKRPREWLGRREGCAEWEIGLVEAVAFHQQYLIERKRPRNYARHGLTKIRGWQN